VKIRFFGKEVALIICVVFLFSAFAFAAKDNFLSIQGKVMRLDMTKKTVVVNETTFLWDEKSVFYDEKGSPISFTEDRLRIGTRVSIDATWKKNKPYTIKAISLLPK
jgi:hypothetical protein